MKAGTPTPIPIFAPVLRSPELELLSELEPGELVGEVLVVDDGWEEEVGDAEVAVDCVIDEDVVVVEADVRVEEVAEEEEDKEEDKEEEDDLVAVACGKASVVGFGLLEYCTFAQRTFIAVNALRSLMLKQFPGLETSSTDLLWQFSS